MNRSELIKQLDTNGLTWDLIVIGGGATGLGIALDAATRGYKTLLLEKFDFSKGTSSRSTKLVHGGVRYLEQGNVALVLEALKERGLLQNNAPHLVKSQSFIIPNYEWWGGPFYTVGLKLYDWLAGKLSLGRSIHLNKEKTIQALPQLRQEGLKGGVLYYDGQFDDSRLAINLAQTAVEAGACVLNYMHVKDLIKDASGKITGVKAWDIESDREYHITGKAVINATGVFVDDILKMVNPQAKRMVRPSQGVHLVLERSFMNGDSALMIPKTDDGRVLFAVPWHNKLIVGTTDTLLEHISDEPRAQNQEIEFILQTAGRYLTRPPKREDVLSVFSGLRPLAAPQGNEKATKEISRGHKIFIGDSGLITITGGKWTTFRKMAQDTVEKAIHVAKLPLVACKTENYHIHGYHPSVNRDDHLYVYGSDIEAIKKLHSDHPEWKERIHNKYPYTKAEVIWAVRMEMARCVEDVLARRIRLLFLDAQAAIDAAPIVAELLASELKKDQSWINKQIDHFSELAKGYLIKTFS